MFMSEVIIRKATVDDELASIEIRHKSWLSAYKNIFSEEEINKHFEAKYNDASYRERNRKRIEKTEHFYIAEQNGKPVAILIVEPNNRFGDAEIECLYCLPEVQRQGIGGMLLDVAKRIFRESFKEKFILFALKENEVGCAFYRNHDGVVVDEYADELCGKIVQKQKYEFDL